MAYTPSEVIKLEKISAAYAPLIEEQLFLPSLFSRQSIDVFKGALGDTISIRVPGVVAAHDYGFRNDRTEEIEIDSFAERKIDVTVGGNAYSGVALTDEQQEFDLISWSNVISMQADAVARRLNYSAEKRLATAATGGIKIGTPGGLRQAIFAAAASMNRLQVTGTRYLLVSPSFEMAMVMDPNLTLASAVGDDIASTVVREAVLGRIAGFTVVSAPGNSVPEGTAIAVTSNAMAWYNGAPAIPRSVEYGQHMSHAGLSLRHMLDYETKRFQEISVVNTWYGFADVTDVYVGHDAEGNATVGANEHFTRALSIEIDGTNTVPASYNELKDAVGFSKAFLDSINPATPPATPEA